MTPDDFAKIISALTALVGVIIAGIALAYNHRSQANVAKNEFVKRQHDAIALILVSLHDTEQAIGSLTFNTMFSLQHDINDESDNKLLAELNKEYNVHRVQLKRLRSVHSAYLTNDILATLRDFESWTTYSSVISSALDGLPKPTLQEMDKSVERNIQTYTKVMNAIRTAIGTDPISDEIRRILHRDGLSAVGLSPEVRMQIMDFAGKSGKEFSEIMKLAFGRVKPN